MFFKQHACRLSPTLYQVFIISTQYSSVSAFCLGFWFFYLYSFVLALDSWLLALLSILFYFTLSHCYTFTLSHIYTFTHSHFHTFTLLHCYTVTLFTHLLFTLHKKISQGKGRKEIDKG